MNEHLLPCPFCGSRNVHAYNAMQAPYRQYNVKCKKCGARICKSTTAEAIEAWNERAVNTAVVCADKNPLWTTYRCECGQAVLYGNNYCPNCGAKLVW